MKKFLPIIIAIPVFVLSLLFLRPEATTPVVVAAADLPEGRTLVAADVSVSQVPKSQLSKAFFNDPSQVIGQTLRVFRGAGEVITLSQLGGEVIRLAPNERAIAIHVTDAAGLAGLIRPGEYVGITAVMDGRDGPFSKTVVSSLRVLYITPEFRTAQGSAQSAASAISTSPFSSSSSSLAARRRELEGTVVLAVPVEAITIGYDFSTFGVSSASRLVSLTDLLPALDLVDSVQLSLFLEPQAPESFITSGLFLPDLVITPGPTPTATPCPGGVCQDLTPSTVAPLP